MLALKNIDNYILSENYFDKDIWKFDEILGAKIAASAHKQTINFKLFPEFYRNCMKRYLKIIVTKRSSSYCHDVYSILNIFFKEFYSIGYTDGFLKSLNREDIEKYIYLLGSKYSNKNRTYVNKLLVYVRNFLEYIQLVEFPEAPSKDVSRLIFKDDIPKRESFNDEFNRIKYIPSPILQQIDNNIHKLENIDFKHLYILLRETGWRGTDILNLRYNNCLQKIWNEKESKYNNYLCGEITKTGIKEHRIPVSDNLAIVLETCIKIATELSNKNNNPKKYLFNTYVGNRITNPLIKYKFVNAIKRLIEENNIVDIDGNIYKFKLHSLRHTRAKELIEQGMNLCVIQQILAHRSMQMTMNYAKVGENTLYEQWKETEKLNIFNLDVNSVNNISDITKNYENKNIETVCVPFGMCSKSSKIDCKQQINHCMTCNSFKSTNANMLQYEEEILRVKDENKIAVKYNRLEIVSKNNEYLNILHSKIDTLNGAIL